MPNTNASFSPYSRVDQLKERLKRLEDLSEATVSLNELRRFDQETEELFRKIDVSEKQMAMYQMATMAEGEALLNLPESAQESQSRDLLQKSIQQRRQMLMGLIGEWESLEKKETAVLTGEDREDPPGL
ncbi:MAG: hypothetical protein R3B74_03805 [Nitrospirales bacterium]|nr:hypothetical protein [Nitrospirales bacterium]